MVSGDDTNIGEPWKLDGRDDAEYASRIRAGDLAAFDALYLAYYRQLWEFAHGLGRSRAVAEELVQDVFAAIWERRASWEPGGSVAFYLYRAVRNRAVSHLRRERVAERFQAEREFTGDADASIPGRGEPTPTPEQNLETADLAAALDRGIAALPARQRLALLLRVREHLSYAEIAELMGVSVPAATILVVRARSALRPICDRFDASR